MRSCADDMHPTLSFLRRIHHTWSIWEACLATLRTKKVRIVIERCYGDVHTTLRLEEAKIADWRCQGVGYPSLSLRKATFPSWRFLEMEDEVIFCLTLAMRSLRATECLVIVEMTMTDLEAAIMIVWTTW